MLKPATRRFIEDAHLQAHHHDPFDRLLMAQALAEPLRLVTAD